MKLLQASQPAATVCHRSVWKLLQLPSLQMDVQQPLEKLLLELEEPVYKCPC